MNQPAVPDEAREVQLGHFDPYKLDPSHILEPPTSFGEIVRQTGPGIVLAASIVGSGELILTTTLGAKVGYTFMWMILLSCLIKSVVQACLGRYAIATAETGLDAVNRIPGPRWRVSWVVWAWAAMVFMTLFQITGMFIGVSQTMNSVFAGVSVRIWVFFFLILTLVLLLGGAYHRIERLAMVKVGVFTLITLMAAVLLFSSPEFSGAEVARRAHPADPGRWSRSCRGGVRDHRRGRRGAVRLHVLVRGERLRPLHRTARGHRSLAQARARMDPGDELRRDRIDVHLHDRHGGLLHARRRRPEQDGTGPERQGDDRHA